MSEFFLKSIIPDLEEKITTITETGGVCFQIIQEGALVRLMQEAKRCTLELVERETGGVIQEARACQDFTNGSEFITFGRGFQELMRNSFNDIEPYPFKWTLHFNSLYLLNYPDGSNGITPHQDSPEYINLIAGFVLEGDDPFLLCDDLEKTNTRAICARRGDVILMRAPGFLPSSGRQFHYVDGIKGGRTTFWVRQSKYGETYRL